MKRIVSILEGFMKNRGIVLFLAAVLLVVPAKAFGDLGNFAVVSDSHIGAPDSVYDKVIRILDRQKIEVIIHVGDAIHNPGRTSQWKRFFEITGQKKTLYFTPGNHDVNDHASYRRYLKLFGKPYSSFTEEDTLLIFLNTELPGEESRITGKQFEWLSHELKRSFRYKFVFLHKPPFPFWDGHGLDRFKEARDRLHELFVENRVSLVVSGHDHIYVRKEKDGIIYVIAAATGGQPQFYRKDTDFFRYIVGTRTKGGYSFLVKDLDGGVKDEFAVAAQLN